jgi:CRISPR system Cascade subunit CasC
MKHVELHILQSFPVSCLNRDDLNSPKTAIFGGVQRARVSSQAWKRAIRELAQESSPSMAGQRTRLVVGGLVPLLRSRGFPERASVAVAELAAGQLSNIDSKKDAQGFNKVTTLCFLSKQEFESIADAMAAKTELLKAAEALEKLLGRAASKEGDEKEKGEITKARAACEKQMVGKEVAKAMKAVQLKDAADIALFGRMVANDHSLTVEGATMFSHALSTHKVDNEIDFFSALDDLQPKQDPAAAITSTLEFNSATYYRFAAVNLDMLRDDEHLAVLGKDDRQQVVRTFIRATLEAVPAARHNSMNGNTRPGYVLGIVRKAGHPIQLVNAFESSLRPTDGKGHFVVSVDALKAEYERLNTTWALKENELVSCSIPDASLSEFLDKVVAHVD